LFFLALVVFFSSTSARNQKKKLERDKFLDCPQIQSLKKAHTVQMHTCVNQKKSSSATPQQAVQKQPGKMMIKRHPLQPPNTFFVWRKQLRNRMLGTNNTRSED
jgi:hypothetical protein